MSDKTGIEWTDATWNPIVGCSIVSKGCTNCYAMKVAGARTSHTAKYQGLTEGSKGGPVWTGEVRFWERALLDPLKWKERRRVFVNSMGDLFHESIPDEWIDRCFAVMALAPQHTFQVLTKRPERMRDYIGTRAGDWQTVLADANPAGTLPITKNDVERALGRCAKFSYDPPTPSWPLANVWLGTSTEDRPAFVERVAHLRETPSAVRFLSVEPLLGDLGNIDLTGVDWVIVGGESGPKARPMHPDWARSVRDQCQAAGVPFFFKQWGEWAPGENADGLPTHTERVAYWFDDKWTFGTITPTESEGQHVDDEPDLYRLGKKTALRSLDGREWSEFPGEVA